MQLLISNRAASGHSVLGWRRELAPSPRAPAQTHPHNSEERNRQFSTVSQHDQTTKKERLRQCSLMLSKAPPVPTVKSQPNGSPVLKPALNRLLSRSTRSLVELIKSTPNFSDLSWTASVAPFYCAPYHCFKIFSHQKIEMGFFFFLSRSLLF